VSRRLILPVVAAMALALPAPASAIVNGDLAAQGEFPAQGVLRISTDDDLSEYEAFCGGTLIGSRQFLTAARCTRDDFGDELPQANFLVRLGNVDRSPDLPDVPDDYQVTRIETAPGFAYSSRRNAAAVLTLNRLADYEPMRVVDRTETALWAAGRLGKVLGWGRTSTMGTRSEFLRKVDVPIIDDTRCANAYGAAFFAALMVCAADPPGTAAAHDSCFDDWGGPLLVPDGGFFALAGIVSSRGSTCGDPNQPGIYSRLGADPLNSWVHDRTPEADFDLSHQPRAGEPVTLFSTSRHPEGESYFTSFKWNFDGDDEFDDRDGKSISATFPTPGDAVVGLQVSRPNGDTAVVYYLFEVGPAPATLGGTTTPPTPAPTTKPVARAPLATILASGRPRVRGGRFPIRVRFARTAPRGTAVIEVYRGSRRIGIARTRVRRGATKRVSVKLTPTGTRLLSRAANQRMRIRVRVRVGRRVLATRQLTIQRLR
jgi:secreted trypsin-like serine protease